MLVGGEELVGEQVALEIRKTDVERLDLGRTLDRDGLAVGYGRHGDVVEGTAEQLDAVVADLKAERRVNRITGVGAGGNRGGCSGGHVELLVESSYPDPGPVDVDMVA